METIKTEVIIVGAGPTGLSLACQLARYGVRFVVVEKNEGVTRHSKAIGVQARTLEIYEQLDLAARAVERGEVAGKIRLLEGGRVRGEMLLSEYGREFSPYPYMLILEQSRNEELLYEYLLGRGEEVRWRTELEYFSQDGAGVKARVRKADGHSQTIEANYLVGCDGAKSPVRHALGLRFEGSTFERLFYVADVRIDWDLPHDAIQVCVAREVFTAFFPMKGKGRYRIVGTFPEGLGKEAGEVVYEEIERQIRREARLPLEISDVKWFSLYKVHSRRVDKFSEGRCFLAGDAAHIHSPAGAQGMNTGIQDAYNLAWKLALVLKGAAGAGLLDTYNEERSENARRLLRTTDRIFELAAGPNPLLGLIRTTLFPPLAGYVAGLGPVRRRMFPLVSQTGINYRGSWLSDHAASQGFKVRAGDRMPFFIVGGRSVYDCLRAPKFHLLTFSRGEVGCRRAGWELEGEYSHLADHHAVALDARARELFGADGPFSLLLRPDNHVAFITKDTSLRTLGAYLESRLAAPSKAAARARV